MAMLIAFFFFAIVFYNYISAIFYYIFGNIILLFGGYFSQSGLLAVSFLMGCTVINFFILYFSLSWRKYKINYFSQKTNLFSWLVAGFAIFGWVYFLQMDYFNYRDVVLSDGIIGIKNNFSVLAAIIRWTVSLQFCAAVIFIASDLFLRKNNE